MSVTVLTRALRDLGVLDTDEDAVWERLLGGFHNDVHVVHARSGRIVVKHFIDDTGNPLYPQLPADEHRALLRLAGSGVAPEPVAFADDVDGRALLVYRFVEGATWSSDVTAVGTLLRRVHASGIVDGFRRLPVTPADLIAQARCITQFMTASPRLAAHLRRAAPTGQPSAQMLAAATLVHTDCGPGNIVVSPTGLCLIDWQCPGIGDPIEDLANFASPAIQILYGCTPLSIAEVSALLAAYGDPATTDRFDRLRWPYHVRLAAYCEFRTVELATSRPEIADRYHRALDAELDLLDSQP